MGVDIGYTARGGDFTVMDTSTQEDGALRVTIRDNRGVGNSATQRTDRATMRRIARRALDGGKGTATAGKGYVSEGCIYVTFVVTRKES